MKRIGIMTTGGDTPALNATIYGAAVRASQLKVEVYGLLQGYNCLFNPTVPHVRLNPLFSPIPELDPTLGGTVLGASRDYIDANDHEALECIVTRLKALGLEGLVVVGGDGSLNGMQPLTERIPAVLAPKTIDNDLGLNYPGEADEWRRVPFGDAPNYRYERATSRSEFRLDQMVNYVTPGFVTAVYVAVSGVQRVRTTAEGHRRIAVVEVMGRQSGFIALGAAYGQPDLVLVPEHSLDVDLLVDRVREIYDLQRNVVIVCGEGIVDENGVELGALSSTTDPAGNVILSGAAEAIRKILVDRIGDDYFKKHGTNNSASRAIFTRKVGHTQRGGRPLLFDRFIGSEIGGKAVEMLVQGQNNTAAVIEWNQEQGFYVDSIEANT
ncbi:MAG: 6-phosphofructokinase, partial [Planctomycetales bacterium]